MALEAPVCVHLITHWNAGDDKVLLAAFNAMMAYSLFIESPVIDLLATSTTLARNARLRRALQTFSVWVLVFATAVHAVACIPSVFNWVTLRLESDVRAALHLPFTVMIPWSFFIGWRRHRQGLLIRQGHTRMIGFGTLIRFTSLFGLGTLLAYLGLPALEVVAIALVLSVAFEAIFIHFCSLGSSENWQGDNLDQKMTLSQMMKFHLPLTATTMLNLVAMPIITNSLASQSGAVLQMAAWQVSMSIVWLFRTVVYALPEVVIALYNGPESERKLRKFVTVIGVSLSALMFVCSLAGIDRWIYSDILKAEPAIADAASLCFKVQFALPLLSAIQSYVRGMLTAWHFTTSRLYAVAVGFSTLLVMLFVGKTAGWPGVVVAGVAMSVSVAAELMVLGIAFKRARPIHQ